MKGPQPGLRVPRLPSAIRRSHGGAPGREVAAGQFVEPPSGISLKDGCGLRAPDHRRLVLPPSLAALPRANVARVNLLSGRGPDLL